jgi:hypothetical protein
MSAISTAAMRHIKHDPGALMLLVRLGHAYDAGLTKEDLDDLFNDIDAVLVAYRQRARARKRSGERDRRRGGLRLVTGTRA